MRNDYIGTSIDGDARASCNSRNGCSSGCGSHQPRTCGCENDVRPVRTCTCENPGRQNRDCACEHDNRQICDCECNSCAGQSRRGCSSQSPAMVYAAHHDLDTIYGCERALIRGTLFGCLDKPMCRERCTENPCITQCQADKFAIWELRLYLNTHPCDQQALALLRKLTAQMDDDCGCAFTPDCSRWTWAEGPWPWEFQRCCGKEA